MSEQNQGNENRSGAQARSVLEIHEGVTDAHFMKTVFRLADVGGWAYLLHHVAEAMAEKLQCEEDEGNDQSYIENLRAVLAKLDTIVNEARDLV